ncbi:MAG: CHASE3 domain-containing protein [Magnetospiraceae bacterium]
MRLGVSRSGQFSLLAAALAFVLLVLTTFYLSHKSTVAADWVSHTHDVQDDLIKLFSKAQDAETGQRGYLLTRDVAYLAPYNEAISDIGTALNTLRRLTSDNPEQQDRLDRLQPVIDLKLAELGRTISLSRDGRHPEAIAIVESDEGKRYMDGIRAIIDDMYQHEKDLLKTRIESLDKLTLGTTAGFIGAIITALVFLVYALRQIAIHLAERTRLELSLLNAVSEADKANQAKSEFLAAMSHELRTPLNGICGFAAMISGEALGGITNKRYVEYARDIETSGQHLLKIVNDILDLSKIEAGETQINPVYFDLAMVMEEVKNLIRPHSGRNVDDIIINIAEDAKHIYADQRSIQQILINLLSNADKYTPMDRFILLRAHRENPDLVIIEVADEGSGIAPESLDTVLMPFGQARDSAEIAHEGTGLGLPIVRHLVDLHGGTFDLKSDLGKGTIVTITLPSPQEPERR